MEGVVFCLFCFGNPSGKTVPIYFCTSSKMKVLRRVGLVKKKKKSKCRQLFAKDENSKWMIKPLSRGCRLNTDLHLIAWYNFHRPSVS